MPQVELEAIPADRQPLLEAMFQLYTYDFTEQWAGLERGELGEDGLFDPYPHLDAYWTEPDRHPYLIRANGHIAGFVLLNAFAHAGLPIDHAVAEFFVVRKHRRSGVGRAAAQLAIAPRPGQWELAVTRRNTAALPFWRRVAGELGEGPAEEIDREDEHWHGPILRFKVA